MSRRRYLWLLPTVAMAATAFAGSATLAQDDPDKLVIGFVPSVEAGALIETIQPLSDYLTEALGMPVEGFVSTDYTALVTAMQAGQAQYAALPPFGLVQAVDTAGADDPAVGPLRQHVLPHPVHDHRCRQVLRGRTRYQRAQGGR